MEVQMYTEEFYPTYSWNPGRRKKERGRSKCEEIVPEVFSSTDERPASHKYKLLKL